MSVGPGIGGAAGAGERAPRAVTIDSECSTQLSLSSVDDLSRRCVRRDAVAVGRYLTVEAVALGEDRDKAVRRSSRPVAQTEGAAVTRFGNVEIAMRAEGQTSRVASCSYDLLMGLA